MLNKSIFIHIMMLIKIVRIKFFPNCNIISKVNTISLKALTKSNAILMTVYIAIVHVNLRSLHAKFDAINDMPSFHNYNSFHSSRPDTKRDGGVSIFHPDPYLTYVSYITLNHYFTKSTKFLNRILRAQ